MKKALFMGLFFYVLGAGAMQELPQEWGEQEWENLKNNENVKSRLRENGIVKYLCTCMLSYEDIEMLTAMVVRKKRTVATTSDFDDLTYYYNTKGHRILRLQCGYFLTHAFKEPEKFTKQNIRRAREYMKGRLHSFSQVEFLQNLANAIRLRRSLSISVHKKPSKSLLPKACWEEDKKDFTLRKLEWDLASSVLENQKNVYMAFLFLPDPLKDLAGRWMKLKEQTVIEKGIEWAKKKREKQ